MKQNPREEREHALRAFNALPMEARLGLMEEAQRIADDLEVPEEQITFDLWRTSASPS